jgi:hypothetical protein
MKSIALILSTLTSFLVLASPLAARQATGTASVVNGFVVAVTVTDGGAGYSTSPSVSLQGGGGQGAVAVAAVQNGSVTQVTVTNAGHDYASPPEVIIAAPFNDPFSEGLVAYFPFDGDARDATDHGHNGIPKDAALTNDRFGEPAKAYYFNNEAQVAVPTLDGMPYYPITYSVWYLAEDPSEPSRPMLRTLIGREKAGYANCGVIALKTETRANYDHFDNLFIYYTGGFQTTPTFKPLFGTWQHLVVTIDSEPRLTWYLDGRVVASEVFAAEQSAVIPFLIGSPTLVAGWDPPPESWRGKIDDVRIYDRALTEAQVRTLHRYERNPLPSLIIEVKTVQVRLQLETGRKYQLQSSPDASSWTNTEEAFVADSPVVTRDFDAFETGRYFRVFEVQ